MSYKLNTIVYVIYLIYPQMLIHFSIPTLFVLQEKRMYSQNGEPYPSDSEESVPPTGNADNRATTPHSNHSLSPTPPKLSTSSPPCVGRTDSFSPRYSPPNITNHLDTNTVVPAISQHDNLTSTESRPSVPNHIDSLSSIPPQTDNRQSHPDGLNMVVQPAHMNSLSNQNSLSSNIQHQVYKTSPQSSPTSVGTGVGTGVANYSMPSAPYQLANQYPHNLPMLNQSQSRY